MYARISLIRKRQPREIALEKARLNKLEAEISDVHSQKKKGKKKKKIGMLYQADIYTVFFHGLSLAVVF